MLEAYKDDPEALWAALHKKYGEHPLGTQRKGKMNKSAVAAAMLILPGGFVVGIPVLLALSLKEYLDARRDAQIMKKRVIKIYEKHNRAKLGEVDRIMQHFKGKEMVLLEKLAEKYSFDLQAFLAAEEQQQKEEEEEEEEQDEEEEEQEEEELFRVCLFLMFF